jgi:hypothetical protein
MMTRNQARMQAAHGFWGRHDRAQRKRDAELERHAEHFRTDPAEHVRIWEAFDGLARILGRDKALAAWTRDVRSDVQSAAEDEKR